MVPENVKVEHQIFNYYYTLLLQGTGQCVDLVEDYLDPILMSQALKDPCHIVTLKRKQAFFNSSSPKNLEIPSATMRGQRGSHTICFIDT